MRIKLLTNRKEMIEGWKEYFELLLDEEFPREIIDRVKWNLV